MHVSFTSFADFIFFSDNINYVIFQVIDLRISELEEAQ